MLARLWKQRWPLLAFALSFQLIENLLFTPALGLVGGVLLGRPVVDSTALVQFLLSPRGFLACVGMVASAGPNAPCAGCMPGWPVEHFGREVRPHRHGRHYAGRHRSPDGRREDSAASVSGFRSASERKAPAVCRVQTLWPAKGPCCICCIAFRVGSSRPIAKSA